MSKSFLYRQRLGYGIGDFASNLTRQVTSLYLLYFYTDVMYLDAAEIAGIFVVCRIIEAITDVFVGYTNNKTHSRWKKTPLFSVRCDTLRVFGISCFQHSEISPKEKFAYAYATYIFPSFIYTVVNIPLASIFPAMTDYMNERTVLLTYSLTLSWIFTLMTPMSDALRGTAETVTARKLSTPRDRHSTFEPQIIPKRSTKSALLEEAILSLYAKGMTVRDIQATLLDLYHVDVSHSLISKVTEVVNEEVQQWHHRPLEAVYPVVWLDGLVVKVHHDHQVLNKTIYLALAINMEGYKELLGIWIAEHEGASFWAQVLTELNNRGVKDVFVFCVDGLTGFPDAIKGVYPKSDIQLCIVHLVRNSLKYVSWKYRKELARDLKEIYHAGTLEGAEAALLRLAEKWNEKSPTIYALWERNWENIITIFTYPAEIRQVIYTTNAIESLNGVIRSRIKTKRILGSDESALKLVWIAV